MRNITSIVILILALLPLKALANNEYYSENIHSYSVLQQDSIDNLPFRGEIYNKEYEVSICFDFYKKNILVPGQDIFGELSGYIKSIRTTRLAGSLGRNRVWIFGIRTVAGLPITT